MFRQALVRILDPGDWLQICERGLNWTFYDHKMLPLQRNFIFSGFGTASEWAHLHRTTMKFFRLCPAVAHCSTECFQENMAP